MTEPLRVGLVGTSGYTELMHIPSIKSHPGAALAAICGRNPARAADVADKHAIPQVFTDYREMLSHGGLQAVVVAASDDMHHPITMAALEAGLHVLCEKPLALTAHQAHEMYAKAEAVGVKHMVCFSNRWTPYFRYVRQLIDEGYLGQCLHCHMRFEGGYSRGDQSNWRFDLERSRGILGDLGSHMVDLGRWLVGEIAAVRAHMANYGASIGATGVHPQPANDSAALIVEFANGAQGTIHVSAAAHVGKRGLEWQIVLHGAAGTLEIDVTFLGAEIRGARHDEEALRVLPIPDELWSGLDQGAPFLSQYWDIFTRQPAGARAFIDAIIDNRRVSPSFFDGLKTQEVIDAALQAHETGCRITL